MEIQNLLDDYENQSLENNEKLDEKFKEILKNRRQAFEKTLEDKNYHHFEYESSIELLNVTSDAGFESNLLFPNSENFTQNQATKECHIILKESYKLKIYGNNNFKNFQKATNQIADLAQNFNVIHETKSCFSWLDIGHNLLSYIKAFCLGFGKGVLAGTETTIDMVIHPKETIENLVETLYKITKLITKEFIFYAHQSLIISNVSENDKSVIEALDAINHRFIFYKDNLTKIYNLSKLCSKNYFESHSGPEILQDSTEFISKTLTEFILPGKALKVSKTFFKLACKTAPPIIKQVAVNSKRFSLNQLKKFAPEKVFEVPEILEIAVKTEEKIKFQIPKNTLKPEVIIEEISEIVRLEKIKTYKKTATSALKNFKPTSSTDLIFND